MFFKNETECGLWARSLSYDVSSSEVQAPLRDSPHAIRVNIENNRHRSYALAGWLVSLLGDFGAALFWGREFGHWPSSENLHLYYRLRSSYRNHGELRDEPGHLALSYERPDLTTLLDLAIRFGWGGHLVDD